MTPVRAAAPLEAAPLLPPLVTTGTAAEPFAIPAACAPADRSAFAGASPSAGGSFGGGAMPGARVNFGGDGESVAGTVARPAASRPAAAEPSFFGSASTGVVEVPELPDFAVVSVIN
ncbi:hypothetical protein KRMM14A1004_62620 [Krasilnikovia sp. MM14-A1004]